MAGHGAQERAPGHGCTVTGNMIQVHWHQLEYVYAMMMIYASIVLCKIICKSQNQYAELELNLNRAGPGSDSESYFAYHSHGIGTNIS